MGLIENIKSAFNTEKASTVTEALEKPVIKKEEIKNPSNATGFRNTDKDLTDIENIGSYTFGNLSSDNSYSWGVSDAESLVIYQAGIIEGYRKLANDPEMSNICDIITNETVFTVEEKQFQIDIDEENENIKKKITETFESIENLLNLKENIDPLVRQMYIDGQLNVALTYNKSKKDQGILQAKIISPLHLFFDKSDNNWKYYDVKNEEFLYEEDEYIDQEYSRDELVHVDYGLRNSIKLGDRLYKLNLSYLEGASKTLNKLNSLEDMLVPMRYSRSVSRRLFNVDVDGLPPAKAKEVMDNIRREFKYKKSYDITTGVIKGMTSQHPLVEDYWLANRNGSKGTTVDTMDEKGSLMDLDDIMLVGKKLYNNMKIPTNRNPYADQDGGTFGYSSEAEISNEELQFYLHIDRLRLPVVKLLKEILKRQLIYTGVFSDKEWKKYSEKINITFTSGSVFIENMKKDLFLRNIENFSNIEEQIGKTLSLKSAISKTMGSTDVELLKELEEIAKEKTDMSYKVYYGAQEDNF